MRHIGLALAALASLAATSAPAQSQDDTIAYSSRKAQPLVTGSSFRNIVFTGALPGFFIDRIEGHHIARDDDVRDLQEDIAFAVARQLAERRGVAVADGPVDLRGVSRRELARNPPPGRYLVDVESTRRKFMWSLIRGQWTRYTVGYRANLSVLDLPNQDVIVRDHCAWSTPRADRLSRARLLDDDSAALKAQFAIAAGVCTARFIDATQGLWEADRREVAEERPPHRMPPPVPVAVAPLPVQTRAPVAHDASPPPPVHVERHRLAPVEYPYARPYEAPPSRAPQSDYAGRDANGFLTWSGKRP